MPTSAAEGEGRSRIVTAEDNPVMAHVVGFNLRQAGYEVFAARNGQEALTRLEQEPADLLITDYQMPILDGWELCQRVRERWSPHQLPIILLSAKGLEIDGDRLVAEGYVQRIVFKPFSPRELVRAAGELIGASAGAPA
jgi:two-component system, chemotaxis family, chemotaxis protein CheY